MSSKTPLVIAHRGARTRAPENTIPAIEEALKGGVDGVEFDVDLTKDNVPILIHQESIAPDGNIEKLKPCESVADSNWTLRYTWREIENADAGSWFSPEFAGVKIPELGQILSLSWGSAFAFMELKDSSFWSSARDPLWSERIISAVQPFVKDAEAAGIGLKFLSFNPHILEVAAQKIAYGERVLALWTTESRRYEQVIAAVKRTGAAAITMPDEMLINEPAWADYADKNDFRLFVYELSPGSRGYADREYYKRKHPVWESLVKLGVHGITSDFPSELKRFLGA